MHDSIINKYIYRSGHNGGVLLKVDIVFYFSLSFHVSTKSGSSSALFWVSTLKLNSLLRTQLSIPTHAQLQRHRLKFIKNHLKKLLHVSVFDHLQGVTMSSLKSLLLLTTVGCFYAKRGDVGACRVVCIGLYLKSAWVRVLASAVDSTS